ARVLSRRADEATGYRDNPADARGAAERRHALGYPPGADGRCPVHPHATPRPLTASLPMTDNDRLNLLLELKRYADAEKLAREAIGRDPHWASGYTHLARALVSLNKKDEAIAAAREGVRKAPTDPWAHATLGCVLNWFGDAKTALEPAQEAVRLDHRY